MYSNIESVQILIAMLKAYNISDVILAPGGSNIPIIHSLENDSYFECYSVVDERSAVYFSMGVAQQKRKPVACICTSGTAVSNFLPGMTEAHFQNVPIVAITADKNPLREGQLETQKIQQKDILKSVVKKEVELPVIKDHADRWYCERLINEALFELNHHGTGPVHINIPIIGKTSVYDCENLPIVRKYNLLVPGETEQVWKQCVRKLEKSERVMLVVGQNINFTDEDKNDLEEFFAKFKCMISVEHMANLDCEGVLHTYPLTEMYEKGMFQELVPDLVISLGNNVASYMIKPFLRDNVGKYEHWQIDECGRTRDMFESLCNVFECKPQNFFRYFIDNSSKEIKNDKKYYDAWKTCLEEVEYPEFAYSNLYIARELAKVIPEKSILHLAILNSTRIMQFFSLKKGVRVYSNIGALGIDGCLSTFMGQAASTTELAFCLIGDLSFFYDMNAAGVRHVNNNVRIILLNNGGGSEFHFFMGKKNIPTIDQFICAEHGKTAKGWIESLGYEYYAVRCKEDFEKITSVIGNNSSKPIFVEVFTDMEEDAECTRNFLRTNRLKLGGAKSRIADMARGILSAEQKELGRKIINKIKR